MSFDIDAYKNARLREMEQEAREDLAKTVAALHERITQLEESLHTKLDALLKVSKQAKKD